MVVSTFTAIAMVQTMMTASTSASTFFIVISSYNHNVFWASFGRNLHRMWKLNLAQRSIIMPENNTYSFDVGENWFSVAGDVDDFIFYGTEEQEKISSER